MAMARDPDCLDWMADYWRYVVRNEGGNQPALSEIGFAGFVNAVLDAGNTSSYLMQSDFGPREERLLRGLEELNGRYAARADTVTVGRR